MDIAARLQINAGLAEKILTGFIRDGVTKVGFQRAVIALSGGIDSALSAYLTVRALGSQNVLGLRMPYATVCAADV
jgi:NAD+ synthase